MHRFGLQKGFPFQGSLFSPGIIRQGRFACQPKNGERSYTTVDQPSPAACPFGARSFNYRNPRPFIQHLNTEFPTRSKGVVEKCNFCVERLAVGKLPACVEASEGKLAFGDLYDSESGVRELIRTNFTIRRKQSLGTEPCVYYIV